MKTETRITEAEIASLLERFYDKVQHDPELGPVFNDATDDRPAHVALLKNVWSTVLLTTGRYKGDPMMTHLALPLRQSHFDRWLNLFEETSSEVLPPQIAAIVMNNAHRIAETSSWGSPCSVKNPRA